MKKKTLMNAFETCYHSLYIYTRNTKSNSISKFVVCISSVQRCCVDLNLKCEFHIEMGKWAYVRMNVYLGRKNIWCCWCYYCPAIKMSKIESIELFFESCAQCVFTKTLFFVVVLLRICYLMKYLKYSINLEIVFGRWRCLFIQYTSIYFVFLFLMSHTKQFAVNPNYLLNIQMWYNIHIRTSFHFLSLSLSFTIVNLPHCALNTYTFTLTFSAMKGRPKPRHTRTNILLNCMVLLFWKLHVKIVPIRFHILTHKHTHDNNPFFGWLKFSK